MEFLSGISQLMLAAESGNSSEDFSRVSSELLKSKDQARETFQKLTANQIEAIIRRLEKNEPLSTEEKDCVEMWMVGDAESYARMEDSLSEWLGEFKRLRQVIAQYESRSLSVRDLLDLDGILEDALRVAGDIQSFLEEKERIDRFKQSIGNLDEADYKMLASILKGKLTSPEM